MTKRHPFFQLRVERVNPGCRVPLGTSLAITAGSATVGRGTDCSLQLVDGSISGLHLEVIVAAEALELVNHSQHGTTAVDGTRLAPGERRRIDTDLTWIQLGKLLLSLTRDPKTESVGHLMPVPSRLPASVLLRMRKLGSRIEVWCGGHAASLFPAAARLLFRLCETPGQVVSTSDLAEAVDPEALSRAGGTNITQLVTYVRDMFAAEIEAGHIALGDLTEACGVSKEQAPAEARAVLRELIESVRGVGYRLHLLPSAIALEHTP